MKKALRFAEPQKRGEVRTGAEVPPIIAVLALGIGVTSRTLTCPVVILWDTCHPGGVGRDGEVVRVMTAKALLLPSPVLLGDADLSGGRPNVDTNSRITTSVAAASDRKG